MSTKLESWKTLQSEGRDLTIRQIILDTLAKCGEATRNELQELTRLRINSLTGQVAPMVKEGTLAVKTYKLDPLTNRRVEVLTINGNKKPN
jgi:hypothetical protein